MLIAEQKRKENIAEFILYIWQLEDILRAYNFDIETINEHIIKRFNQPESVQLQIRQSGCKRRQNIGSSIQTLN